MLVYWAAEYISLFRSSFSFPFFFYVVVTGSPVSEQQATHAAIGGGVAAVWITFAPASAFALSLLSWAQSAWGIVAAGAVYSCYVLIFLFVIFEHFISYFILLLNFILPYFLFYYALPPPMVCDLLNCILFPKVCIAVCAVQCVGWTFVCPFAM